jgi:hypothetical protein
MKPVCQYDYSYLLPKETPLLIRSKGTVAPCPSPITIPTINAPTNTLAPKAEPIGNPVFHFTDMKGNIVKFDK